MIVFEINGKIKLMVKSEKVKVFWHYYLGILFCIILLNYFEGIIYNIISQTLQTHIICYL